MHPRQNPLFRIALQVHSARITSRECLTPIGRVDQQPAGLNGRLSLVGAIVRLKYIRELCHVNDILPTVIVFSIVYTLPGGMQPMLPIRRR